jgi:hypothetical protein
VKTPERRVKDDVAKKLRHAKAYYCMPVQMGLGRNNMLDVIACVPTTKACVKCGHPAVFGQFVSIETKAFKKSRLTGRQRRAATEIRHAKGIVFVVRGDRNDPKGFTWEAR